MITFYANESELFGDGEVLISLPKLLARLPGLQVELWALRSVTIVGHIPFCFTARQLEDMSSSLEKGLLLGNKDFSLLISSDLQFIDGVVEGYPTIGGDKPIIEIECVDSTWWELRACTPEVQKILERPEAKLSQSLPNYGDPPQT